VFAVSTVIVVVEPDVDKDTIFAPDAMPVPEILSPASAWRAITDVAATPKVRPADVPATVTAVVASAVASAPSTPRYIRGVSTKKEPS